MVEQISVKFNASLALTVKTKALRYLSTVVLLVWIIPWQGKRLLPMWFDSNLIQWSGMGVLAILCPIGALLSMSAMAEQRRREGYFYLIGFSFPVIFFFCSWGIYPALFASSAAAMQPTYKDFDAIAKLVEGAHDSSIPLERRFKQASVAYRNWGIAPVVLAVDGQLTAYTPTTEDGLSRQKNLDQRASIEKILAVLDWQLKQVPLLFLSFLGASVSVFFLGLGVYAFRRPRQTV